MDSAALFESILEEYKNFTSEFDELKAAATYLVLAREGNFYDVEYFLDHMQPYKALINNNELPLTPCASDALEAGCHDLSHQVWVLLFCLISVSGPTRWARPHPLVHLEACPVSP